MKVWSEKEVEILKKNYKKFRIEDLAKELNRSPYSIGHKLIDLDLKKGFSFCKGAPVKWTKKEKRILLKHTHKSIKKLSKLFNKSELQIRYAIRKFKIERKDPIYWSEKEIELLKNNIDESFERLAKLFPNRTIKAVIGKKDKLKLRRKSKFYWSEKEDKYLIENYHKKSINVFIKVLNKTPDAIYARRTRLLKEGIKIKDKKKFLSRYWKKQYKTNKNLIKKHQLTIDKMWNDSEFRKRRKLAIKNKFKDPKFFEKHKILFLNRRNSKAFREKQSKIASEMLKKRHRNPEEHRKILLNLRQNPSNQQLLAIKYLKKAFSPSNLGCNDWDILDGEMEIDIPIYSLKIAIEWDGKYWHYRNRNVQKRDKRKNDLLIERGWKFIRICDNGLSKDQVGERCNQVLEIVKLINDPEFKCVGGFYI